MTKTLALTIATSLAAVTAASQTLVIEGNSNRRPDPSNSDSALRFLKVPARDELLNPTRQDGYLKVRTFDDAAEGWVWSPNGEIETAPERAARRPSTSDASVDFFDRCPLAGARSRARFTC